MNYSVVISIFLLVLLIIFNYYFKNKITNTKLATIIEVLLYLGLLFLLVFRWINKLT